MRLQQISIFLENKIGRLKEVTLTLKEAGVNIRTLTLSDTSDFGVLRIIVDDNEKAEKALKNEGFTFSKTNVVAVEVNDKPGGLHNILSILDSGNVNVEYLYAFVNGTGDNAINIFRFDNTDAAVKVLTENGINVIEGKKLYNM